MWQVGNTGCWVEWVDKVGVICDTLWEGATTAHCPASFAVGLLWHSDTFRWEALDCHKNSNDAPQNKTIQFDSNCQLALSGQYDDHHLIIGLFVGSSAF